MTNLSLSDQLRSNFDFVQETRVADPLECETQEGIIHHVIIQKYGSHAPVFFYEAFVLIAPDHHLGVQWSFTFMTGGVPF